MKRETILEQVTNIIKELSNETFKINESEYQISDLKVIEKDNNGKTVRVVYENKKGIFITCLSISVTNHFGAGTDSPYALSLDSFHSNVHSIELLNKDTDMKQTFMNFIEQDIAYIDEHYLMYNVKSRFKKLFFIKRTSRIFI